MLAFLIAPFYIALNIYILIWLIRWLKACHGFFHKKWVHAVIIILYALAAFSMLAGPVSYTHLDVYKRQVVCFNMSKQRQLY